MILEKRLEQIYSAALEKCLKKYKEFLQKVQDVDDGKIQPPQWYVDRNMVDKWRQGFLRELIRQEKIIDGIMQEMVNAGMEAEKLIKESMVELYRSTRAQAAKRIEDGAKANGVHIRLREMDRQAVKTILQEEQSPFSKIAFNNLGKNIAIRRKLQNDMALSILLGESQRKMSQRIRRVAGMAKYQADRVAQTERTRVQAQATMQTSQEAEKLGVRVYHKWSTRMVRSRDTHITLDGKCALPGEKFPGSVLRYPGDPTAPAGEVINCHCVLIEHVLLPNEQIVDGRVVKINAETLKNQEFGGIIKSGENYISNKGFMIHQDKIKKFLLKPGTKHYQEFYDAGYRPGETKLLALGIEEGYDETKAVDKFEEANGGARFSIFMDLGFGSKKRFRTVWKKDSPDSMPRLITAHRE